MKFANCSKPRSITPLKRHIQTVLIHASRVLAPCLAAPLLFVAVPGRTEDMLVSAAASLTNAFKEIGTEFEKSHPGTKVNFNFAASDILMKQIVEGAPADVFASADLKAMDSAAQQNAIDRSTRKNFAANRLALALPSDAKLTLTSLEDLKQDVVKRIAISQPATVPVGRYAKAALAELKLWSVLEDKLVFTQNVRQTLDYVSRGEVDAGFVYTTGAAIMKDKVKVAFEIPTPQPVVYPIAVTKRSKQGKLAREFVDLVNSEAGQTIPPYPRASQRCSTITATMNAEPYIDTQLTPCWLNATLVVCEKREINFLFRHPQRRRGGVDKIAVVVEQLDAVNAKKEDFQ